MLHCIKMIYDYGQMPFISFIRNINNTLTKILLNRHSALNRKILYKFVGYMEFSYYY